MINDEICNLREQLNKSIELNEDYEIIYQLSVKLDELIEKYYGIDKKIEEIKEEKLVIYE